MNKKKGLISVFALAILALLAALFALGGCGNAIGALGEINGSNADGPPTLLAVSPTPAPVSTINAGATELSFVLDTDTEYEGEWTVYKKAEGGVASTMVSASFAVVNDEPTLTLKSESPIAPRTWYVSLKEEGKAESEERFALWGEPDAGGDPMSLAKRFRLVERDGLPDALPAGNGGTDAVRAVFNALHGYLQDKDVKTSALTAASSYAVPGIVLGDWVDLPSLTVAEYKRSDGNTIAGAITITSNTAIDAGDPDPDKKAKGKLLRLIVVGNNSFHSGKGVGGAYTVTANNDTPHLVFQFQNIPGLAKMQTGTAGGGYLKSGMRAYLVPVIKDFDNPSSELDELDPDSGKFLEGLKNAGVPEDWLFAPKRYVTNNGKRFRYDPFPNEIKTDLATGADEIQDKVWLPTVRELFGEPYPSNEAYETAANQARLEYYSGADDAAANAKRVKYTSGGDAGWYWEASPGWALSTTTEGSFCEVNKAGAASYLWPNQPDMGVAPAFCVK